MYFEFLGLNDGFGIKVSFTMMVGPFTDQKTMEVFLEKCHQVVNAGKVNPHTIKFIPHAKLPIIKADPNEFTMNDDTGEMVLAPARQWSAISPKIFMDSIKAL